MKACYTPETLKYVIKHNNITQKQLADLIGSNESYISACVSGKKLIKKSALPIIAEKYKCVLERLESRWLADKIIMMVGKDKNRHAAIMWAHNEIMRDY